MKKSLKQYLKEDDKPVKTANPTIDMDILDEPTGNLPASAKTSDVTGPSSVSDLRRASAAGTTRATAGISQTDQMRDLMNRITLPDDDYGVDEPETALVPHEPITTANLPAVISREIAMTDPNAINPEWHTVANLPGNVSRVIRRIGKELFAQFTRTPTEEIVMIGAIGDQGPNSAREVRGVINWIEKNGTHVDDATINFDQFAPGYSATTTHYTAGGVRYDVIKDFIDGNQVGVYVYAWPESDSIGAKTTPAIDQPTRTPNRSLLRR